MAPLVTDFARHYATLLLDDGSSLDEVKRAFRSLSRMWHPDQYASEPAKYKEAAEKQRRINESYSALNKYLRSNGEISSTTNPSAGQPAPTPTSTPTQSFATNFSETRSESGGDPLRGRLQDELLMQGKKHQTGNGCEVSVEKAIGLYKQAARMGSAAACFRLGCIFMNGEAINQKLAADYFAQGANLGHVASMFNLALMHERGLGIKRDVKKAVEFYQHAASRGDKQASQKLEKLAMLRSEPKPSMGNAFAKSREAMTGTSL